MTQTLPLRLVMFVVLPIIAASMIMGVWAFGALEQQLVHRLQREVEMVARALQLPLGKALHGRGSGGVKLALDSAFAIGRVYGAYVYDGQGDLVAASAPQEPADTASGPTGISAVIARGKRVGRYDEVDGRQVYSYFVPLNAAGGEMIGVLRVTREKSDLIRYVDDLRDRALLMVSVAAIALTTIVLLGYYAAAGHSLSRFANSIRRVASGEREHRVALRGPREFATLAGLFNSMLDSLSETERRAEKERRTRRTVEQQLRHSERLATIGQVTAGIAHELGTPLSTVSGHAERVLRRHDLQEPVRASLETLQAQTTRMERLVKQLLDYGAKHTLSFSRTDSHALMASSADALAPIVQSTGISLTIVRLGKVKLEADRSRLEQALINLIRNALQAAAHRVEVQCQAIDDSVVFIVDDDGPGVSPTIRPRLGEPFVTDKATSGGTGLGLAICTGIAQAHGGELRHTSSPLGGARFVLSISLKPDTQGSYS